MPAMPPDFRSSIFPNPPEIKANTCAYCGAPYTVADGGCRDKCPDSQKLAQLIKDAIVADEQRDQSQTIPDH